jgi:hypothetical protein
MKSFACEMSRPDASMPCVPALPRQVERKISYSDPVGANLGDNGRLLTRCHAHGLILWVQCSGRSTIKALFAEFLTCTDLLPARPRLR